ncbi:bacteriohemerythrin [Candidatus Halobeggiatoa sp. HSG11]|nr:bacteriohemerythrin [Candidatus Halobeggiatoa sp. HSG11]
MFKNFKINSKLMLMVALPLLGLIYFTIDNTLNKLIIVEQMNSLQELSELAITSSALIHELQKERGISAGFIGGLGRKFVTELENQRVKTDVSISHLKKIIDTLILDDKKIQDSLQSSLKKLQKINSKRILINRLEIDIKEELRYYTSIIDSLLASINYLAKIITDGKLSHNAMAYVNLLQAKEKAGIERGTLNNAFSKGHFDPTIYKKFILLVGAQDIYIKNFFFFATEEQQQFYKKIINYEATNKVKLIREMAFKKASKSQILSELRSNFWPRGLIQQLQNYVLWDEVRYLNEFYQQYQNAFTLLESYKNLPYVSKTEYANIKTIQSIFNKYKDSLAIIIELKKKSEELETIENIIDDIDYTPATKAFNDLLNGSHLGVESIYWWKIATDNINRLKQVEDKIANDLKQSAISLRKKAHSTFAFYLLLSGITTLLTVLLTVLFAHNIVTPLKSLVRIANQITLGNRDIDIDIDSKDETGQLSNAMLQMVYSINCSESMLKDTSVAYARFVPDEFLELLSKKHIVEIQLGNHIEINMTVLFADIRSFTSISEKMSPQDTFNLINNYLNKMGPIIHEHNGIVDKYIGDAIMALFINADDAVKASIEMLQKLDDCNSSCNPIRQYQKIKVGIGLNTGKLMLGIIGEANRLQCTVISDAVNLASRLEGATKTYKCSLIISQNTYTNLSDHDAYAIRFLDNIRVKGRYERINIFEVFDCEPQESQIHKHQTLQIFEEAVHLYQEHKFIQVGKLMQKCLQLNPFDAAAEIYLQRCRRFLKVGSSEYWEQVAIKINWKNSLSVSDPTIDDQHREIFIRIKNLVMSIGSGVSEEEIFDMLDFLGSYVTSHFTLEEMYMEIYNYPHHAFHKEQHTMLIKTYERFKRQYKENGGDIYFVLQIQQKIVEWVIDHINKEDKDLWGFLLNRR